MNRQIVVLGGGTAGTMLANQLRRKLPRETWSILVVDRDDRHLYQPGLLFVPFGKARVDELVRPRHTFIPDGVDFEIGEVDIIDTDAHTVRLSDGRAFPYDLLVIASGARIRPDQTPGMLGPEWQRSVFDFYTPSGADALAKALSSMVTGRLVVHLTELPIKCPVAPTFLADAWLRQHGRRAGVEITYVTPLSDAFTKPSVAKRLGSMLAERDIELETDFVVERVDTDAKALVSYDERTIPFDLFVTTPLTTGADFVTRSGLGDDMGFVPVDKHTLQSLAFPDVFAIGDAADLPTSKAGSAVHYQMPTVVANIVSPAKGEPVTAAYDGHVNCFIESGGGKALLIDFDYQHDPIPGGFPLPGIGPLSLLAETRRNHLGKLAFRPFYWNVLLPGHAMTGVHRSTRHGTHHPEPTAPTGSNRQQPTILKEALQCRSPTYTNAL